MILESLWKELLEHAEPRHGEGVLRRRVHPASPLDLFVGIRHPGRQRVLLLHSRQWDPTVRLPETSGLRCSVSEAVDGWELEIAQTREEFTEVFVALCSDLVASVGRIADETLALRRILGRLQRWQALLKRAPVPGLTMEEQRGLFGELVVLRDHVLPALGAEASVRAWTGSGGSWHDFETELLSVEVKTTAAAAPHCFHVASEKQLATGTRPLYVGLLQVDVEDHGGLSLPELVNVTRRALAQTPGAVEEFNDKLLESGYLDSHETQYATPGYRLGRLRAFEVRAGFPRIAEESLPEGVGDLRYTVSVSACEPFAVDESVLSQLLRRASQ